MIEMRQAVIVEGKYDKIRLENIVDTLIIETDGFRIFSDEARRELIRRLARTRGIVILTDSDAAGFRIRHYISSFVKEGEVIQVYAPDILGKEKRKAEPSREGKLGVEGIADALLIDALRKAGVTCESGPPAAARREITPADLYELGLSGGPNAADTRRALLSLLRLPARLSKKQLIDVLNDYVGYDELRRLVRGLRGGEPS